MSLKSQIIAGNLLAWWGHNEASGNLIDLHTNGYDLAEFNTVARQSGLLGNASKFTAADVDYYEYEGGTELLAQGDWTLAFWVKDWPSMGATNSYGINAFGSGTNNNFFIDRRSNGAIRLFFYDPDGSATALTYNSPPLTTGWDNIWAWRTATEMFLQINDNPPISVANTKEHVSATHKFRISTNFLGGFDVPVDETSVWSTVLTSAERLEYYNSGVGVSYDDVKPQAPDAPTALTATATASTKIALTWVDNSDDETGFKVERSLDGATGWTLIQTTAADVETYTDTGLTPGITYYYRVAATNAEGDSAYTATANATTLIGTPTVVLTETKPTVVLTESVPAVELTESIPTVVLTEL